MSIIKETKINKAISAISKNGSFTMKKNPSLAELLNVKEALSGINNSITSILSKKFINFLFEKKLISKESKIETLNKLESTSPNANGYDIRIDREKIIAEIKANILFKNKYGTMQLKGIEKDLKGLCEGKTKEKINSKNYYKFMVLLDYEYEGTNTMQAFIKLLNAKDRLYDKNQTIGDMFKCKFYSKEKTLDKKYVYILLIK